MKLKMGYKLVQLKPRWLKVEIPEEWEIKTFDELFEFLTTGSNPRSDLAENGDIQYIHYGDIHQKWNLILDCDSEKIPYINKTKVERIPLLKDGDLIIADASEDYEGSGSSILLKNVKNKKIVSGLHTLALRNKDENVSLDFNAYLTSIRAVKQQIISYVSGVSVYGLSKNNLKQIKIPLPTLPEQRKIVSVLSDINELVQQVNRIIDQIKLLKKGLMQKLLIKGVGHEKNEFKKIDWYYQQQIEIPEKWEKTTLGDVCDKIQDMNHDMPKKQKSGIHFLSISHIINESEIDFSNTEYISKEDYETILKKIQPKKNDLLYSRVAVIGEVRIIREDKKFAFTYNVALIKTSEKVNSVFLMYMLDSSLITSSISTM